ncbi:MAG TPA: xanthine dehydrogenase [Methylocella sp.]|nr:xanthine dehydrogenase [Methylocella sp.]
MKSLPSLRRRGTRAPFAVILGTNEIASAVAVSLHRAGACVVLSHDPMPPVIRRKMAFHDCLYDEPATLGGVPARRADTGLEILSSLRTPQDVLVTELGVLDLIILPTIDVLIDARVQKYQVTPDLRPLARFTIGLGPGFDAGTNCDSAIETRPAKTGRIIRHGQTDAADGQSRRLGTVGAERFVYSSMPGRWHSAIEIGTRIYKNFPIGHLSGTPIGAPFDGIVRGVVRDGTEVPAGVKLLEVDPRGRQASFEGLDRRGCVIAASVMKAIAIHDAELEGQRRRLLTLVK